MDFRKSLQNIIENIIAYLFIVAVGGAAMVFTILKELPLYQLLLLLLAAIGLILLVINQYATWKERRKKKLTKLSDKELEARIREWINIPAWSVQLQPPIDDVSFAYKINHQNSFVYVHRHVAEPSVIGLSSKLVMHSTKTELSKYEWERLEGQLSIEMARLGIEWDFVGSPNKWDTIELIEPVILDDSLTSFYFRSRVMFVVRAIILVHEIWNENLRQSKNSTS
jgi:hypothetical protein